MRFPRGTVTALSALSVLAALVASPLLQAAPLTINGASFDAPEGCQPAGNALVCKVDGQQMELWVNRRPPADGPAATETLAQRMAWLQGMHDAAVKNIMRSTFNDKVARFDGYGSYPALGSAMPGKGTASSPTVRFASVLRDGEYWEFLEVAAVRSPAVEAVSAALQKSLVLPLPPPMPGPAPAADVAAGSGTPAAAASSAAAAPAEPDRGSSPLTVTFDSRTLSFQVPGYLAATVEQNLDDRLRVSFRHKTRKSGGPTLQVVVQPLAAGRSLANVEREQRTATAAGMVGQPSAVDIGKLGSAAGKGFAMVGTTRAKPDNPPVEALETFFAAEVNGSLLELRLSAEQQYAGEAQSVWALVASSLAFKR